MADGGVWDCPPLEEVARVIKDPNEGIEKRMKALFNARHHGGDEAVEAICGAVGDPSVLLVHEAAYVLGQLQCPAAVPTLQRLLADATQHSMVRHEAAEALGALGDVASLRLIEKYCGDDDAPVRETCQLARRSLLEKAARAAGAASGSPDSGATSRTVLPAPAISGGVGLAVAAEGVVASDALPPSPAAATPSDAAPSPSLARCVAETKTGLPAGLAAAAEAAAGAIASGAASGAASASAENTFYLFGEAKFPTFDPVAGVSPSMRQRPVAALRELLCDAAADLYERYRALFALRDKGDAAAVEAVAAALAADDSSALLRHELAFVLGQLQAPEAVPALAARLADRAEHPMARHEAALALGGVGCGERAAEVKEGIRAALQEFAKDADPIVAESCLVALDNIRDEEALGAAAA